MTKHTLRGSPSGRPWLDSPKQPIDTLATSNVDPLNPPATINGRVLVNEDRVLLLNQTNPDENGIYGFIDGDLVRDFDWLNEEGQLVEVIHGTYVGRLMAYVEGAWVSFIPVGGATTVPSVKLPVAAMGDVNVNIAAPPATIGGAAIAVNERYLLNAQTTSTENGTYVYNGTILVPATDFASIVGDIVLITSGTYSGAYYEYRGGNQSQAIGWNRLLTFSTVAAARAYTILRTTREPVYIQGLGIFLWKFLAAGGDPANDTGTEVTSTFAVTGFVDGAYVLEGPTLIPLQTLALGTAWVTVATVPLSTITTRSTAEVAFDLFVGSAALNSENFRGIAVFHMLSGTLSLVSVTPTFSTQNYEAQILTSANNAVLQVRQLSGAQVTVKGYYSYKVNSW